MDLYLHLDTNLETITSSAKPGASVDDFLTRLEECRGITPVTDDDLLRALPLLLKYVALLWFRISDDDWWNWPEFKIAFRRRFGNFDIEARVREQIFNRTQGPKKSMDDHLTHLRGLIAMLKVKVPLVEQLDWAYRGLRPEFKKVIRKFEFQGFNELVQIGRSWEMAWAAVKEYRVPPPPESSFLPEFPYRAENTPAAHKQTSASAISEATSPPRNSGGPHLASRDTKGQGNMGQILRWGEVSRVRAPLEKKPLRTQIPRKKRFVLGVRSAAFSKQAAHYRGSWHATDVKLRGAWSEIALSARETGKRSSETGLHCLSTHRDRRNIRFRHEN